MDFRQHLTISRTSVFDFLPLVNLAALLLIFFLVAPMFSVTPPMKVRLPGAVTSDAANGDTIMITISSENIIFRNNKIVTLNELRELFLQPENRRRPVLIKADRRASIGRIVDLWNLGREAGVERINVASDREE